MATLVLDGEPHNSTLDHSDLVCELAQQRLEVSVSISQTDTAEGEG